MGVNYYITECIGNSISLETRCGREKQHSAEGALGDLRLNFLEIREFWRQDAVEKASTQQRAGPPGLRLSNHGERERHNADGHKSGGQYVAVLFGL